MSISDTGVNYNQNVRNRKEVKTMSMYQFYCEYKTKGGQRCGETIFARDSLEAREIIKMRPDFDYLFNSPKKVG